MVVGRSGDGKTSLIARLMGEAFPEDHVITNGIDADLCCKVNISHCNEAWKRHLGSKQDILQQNINVKLSESFKRKSTGQSSDIAVKTVKVSAYENKRSNGHDNIESGRLEDARPMLEANAFKNVVFDEIDEETQQQLKDVHRTGLEQKGVDNCLLTIWDFGGQIIYYILHHIFLRCRCVYILVINLSTDLYSPVPQHEMPEHGKHSKTEMKYWEAIEFWLNMIVSHIKRKGGSNEGESENVIIVGTHKDLIGDTPQEQDKKANEYFKQLQGMLMFKEHAKLIRDFIAVDSKGGDPENFEKLRSEIMDAIKEHCYWNKPRPVRWLHLEKKLHELLENKLISELDKHVVNYQRMKVYGNEFHLTTDEDIEAFLNFHHLTADLTYTKGGVLGDYVVASPQWLIDVFRALITLDDFLPKVSHQQQVSQLKHEGILNAKETLLPKVWNSFLQDDWNGMVKQYLLALMVEYDLAVKLTEDIYILPCLLPVCPSSINTLPSFRDLQSNMPSIFLKFHSSKASHDNFKIGLKTYDNFLPHGLFHKLVSRCSKEGWVLGAERYQNSVAFNTKETVVLLETNDTWIKIDVLTQEEGQQVCYNMYYATVQSSVDNLLSQYHTNMWYELAVNPCEKAGHECVVSTGRTSLSTNTVMARCPLHSHSMKLETFLPWFCK